PRREDAARSADAARTEKAAFEKVAPAPEPPPREKPGLTRDELAGAAGLEEWQLAELESFGLITPVAYDDHDVFFNDEGQAIAKAAAGFYSHGIGARHLRMYKPFPEREPAPFEQAPAD